MKRKEKGRKENAKKGKGEGIETYLSQLRFFLSHHDESWETSKLSFSSLLSKLLPCSRLFLAAKRNEKEKENKHHRLDERREKGKKMRECFRPSVRPSSSLHSSTYLLLIRHGLGCCSIPSHVYMFNDLTPPLLRDSTTLSYAYRVSARRDDALHPPGRYPPPALSNPGIHANLLLAAASRAVCGSHREPWPFLSPWRIHYKTNQQLHFSKIPFLVLLIHSHLEGTQ